jgi:hypothetical protein
MQNRMNAGSRGYCVGRAQKIRFRSIKISFPGEKKEKLYTFYRILRFCLQD